MNLTEILSKGYDLKDCIITSRQGGWTSLAYKVENSSGAYFLKVYEKNRKSTYKWTAFIDNYIPIVIWLNDNYLKGRIIEPLLTSDNSFKYENEQVICLLFKYIDGETIGKKVLNTRQTEELAGIISELHRHGEDVPFSKDKISENYDLPFCDELLSFIESDASTDKVHNELKEVILPYEQRISEIIELVKTIRDKPKSRKHSFVLCHSDIHNWNLMQTKESLVLIDWEGLKFAPPESDLYALIDEPYFDEFMAIYMKKHESYQVDKDLIAFYRLRRKMEDIWEFIELLLTPELDTLLKHENLEGLKNELLSLSELT